MRALIKINTLIINSLPYFTKTILYCNLITVLQFNNFFVLQFKYYFKYFFVLQLNAISNYFVLQFNNCNLINVLKLSVYPCTLIISTVPKWMIRKTYQNEIFKEINHTKVLDDYTYTLHSTYTFYTLVLFWYINSILNTPLRITFLIMK